MIETAGARLGHVASVRVRITLVASLVTAVAVACAGWLLVRSVEDTQLSRLRDRAQESVEAVATSLEAGATWETALVVDLPAMVVITDDTGRCMASNPTGGGGTLQCGSGPVSSGSPLNGSLDPADGESAPPPTGGMAGENGARETAISGSEIATEAEVVTRQVDTDAYGALTVTAGGPSIEVARGTESVGNVLWVLLPGLVGVVALVAWWLSGRALRPVEAIRAEAEEIGGTTIHRRLPEPDGNDEIGRLARTMNAMLERLDASARRQRQFVSDASHELRSPVAAIRTDLEVALEEGDDADWPTVAHSVLAEEGRLETLLGDLLVLASDDESGATAAQAATVDLARLAAGEAARGRRVPVTLDGPLDGDSETFLVAGVAARIERALANLIDNAARHATREVRITVRRDHGYVRVIIDDDGPGIPAQDRERIFERFTRLDDSRARDRGGAGLGLAVVRSIATRHGGSIWADDSPLGGARFTLELPAATGDSLDESPADRLG